MSTIATTFPDIPRLYTGIAEWASCLLFICFLPRKRSNAMVAVIAAVFLLVQCLFLIVTAEVPLFLWIPCMLAAFGLMLSFLALCIEYPLHICLYYSLLSLVTAELMASMGWQIVREVYRWHGKMSHGLTAVIMAVTYAMILAVIAWIERRTLEAQLEVRVQWADLIPPLIIVVATFSISNLGFALNILGKGAAGDADLFNTRTLVDLGGLVLLYAIRLRLIGIHAQRELERIQTILNAQYEKYRNAREAIDMVNFKYHDIKHQIIGLRAEMDPEKRNRVLAEMEAQLEEYKPERQTGNPVLDAILSGKEAQIRGLGIAFTCVADGALLSPMHVVDICSIFGNALENAIECEATVQERGRRWVHMVITEKKGFVYSEISNYCEGEILMKDGLPLTTKRDRGLHGYGVRSISYTARKYSGTATFEQKEEQFTVRILIPKPVTQAVRQNPVL
jgi:hypothetical protein